MQTLSDNVLISHIEPRPADPGVGGDVFTDGIDMEGFDGVLIVMLAGAMGGPTSDLDLQLQESDDDGVTDAYSDVGAPLNLHGSSTANLLGVADVGLPAKRWLRGHLTWNTANSEPNGVIAIRYGGRRGNLGALDGSGFSIESPDIYHLLKLVTPT